MRLAAGMLATGAAVVASLAIGWLFGWANFGVSSHATASRHRTGEQTEGGEAGRASHASAAGTLPEAELAEFPGWPNMFGPRHNSTSSETNLNFNWPEEGLPERWRKSIGAGYSVPVIQGERLILFHRIANKEIVSCLDPETGDERWTFQNPTNYRCKYEYSSGPYSTPAFDSDHLYAWGAEGKLYAVRLADGVLEWKRHLNAEFAVEEGLFAVASSPIIEGDLLILNVGGAARGAGVVALDRRTGKTVWQALNRPAGYGTPRAATMHGRRMLFLLDAEGLVALDVATGKEVWEIPFKPQAVDASNATSPAIWGDCVLVASGPGPGALCVRVLPDGSYEKAWADEKVLDSQFNTLITLNRRLSGFTKKYDGAASFRSVDIATGKLCWEHTSEICRGSALAVDGRFLLWGESGHLSWIAIDGPTAAAGPNGAVGPMLGPLLKKPCYSAPALHRGLLYLRNETTLLCLDLRKTDR